MRDTGPVTQKEYPFPAGKTLVSVTDLKGRIVYANKAFIMVSGYTQDELLGQPHNLIRHPDIPAEAFRDLWDTVDKGLPWAGIVKNRRKNGDHYWVHAHVTPVFRDGTMVGHLSVRTAPPREAVQAAEGLYARMREEAQSGALRLVLRGGQLRRADLPGRIAQAVADTIRWWGVSGMVLLPVDGVALEPEVADFLLTSQARSLPPSGRLGVGIEAQEGRVRVASVEPNSGAEEAGVREGDEIVAIDGHPVARFSDVRLALWERSAGEKSTVEILRRRWIGPDEPATLTVTLR